MTVVGPILMASLMILPIWLSQVDQDEQYIQVIDESGIFVNNMPGNKHLNFSYSKSGDLQLEKDSFYNEEFTALLYIPRTITSTTHGIQLYYKKQLGIATLRYIEKALEQEIENNKLAASGIDINLIKSVKTNVDLITIGLDESGDEEKSFTELSMVVGLLSGTMIYIFIFLYGTMVMRGVIEEKTNRIVEIIISSVKPFQLMMGKIVGVALVGLTQFLLWIALTFGIVSIVSSVFLSQEYDPEKIEQKMTEMSPGNSLNPNQPHEIPKIGKITELLDSIDFGVMLISFLFYFLFGYLLYSALFAAIGSAVDNEADTQQFILPITIPLIFSIVMSQFIIQNPESQMAFWMSMCPLTSPVIMMVRIPFGVPYWEIGLSFALLIGGFIATTWLAAKIYRTGILMYGKKVNYKELWKWIRY